VGPAWNSLGGHPRQPLPSKLFHHCCSSSKMFEAGSVSHVITLIVTSTWVRDHAYSFVAVIARNKPTLSLDHRLPQAGEWIHLKPVLNDTVYIARLEDVNSMDTIILKILVDDSFSSIS
jgi:hypothetical protein